MLKTLVKNYLRTLTPIDVLVAFFSFIMILLLTLRIPAGMGTALKYIVIYFTVMIGAMVVAPILDRTRHPLVQNPTVRFVRYVYPMFLLGPFFQWTYPISRLFFAMSFDNYLIRADIVLFGFDISRDLVHRWGNSYWAAEWFNFSYLSYYWVTLYLPLYLYFKKRYNDFFYVAFIAGLTIYTCFIFHVLFPAQGPVHFNPSVSGYLDAGPVSSFARWFLSNADIPGGAMPSGHIAGAIAIFFLAWRFTRRAFWVTAPVVISLCIATVYCRYHYAVDGIAGIFIAIVGVYFIGPKLYGLLFPNLLPAGEEEQYQVTIPV